MENINKIEKESVIDPPKNDLNHKIFNGLYINKRILKSFKKLINNFINEIPLKKFQDSIEQNIFVGSMAGYQWHDDADIDLHVVIDSEELANYHNMSTIELMQTLRDITKKFNKRFYIVGYPIEFYIQEKNEPFYSNGIYDIDYNTWIKKPEINEYDKKRIKEAKNLAKQYKYNFLQKIKEINKDLKNAKNNEQNEEIMQKLSKDKEYLKSEINQLKEKRKKAIQQEGDIAIDNMIIKFLGRMKIIKKIKDKIEELEKFEFN